MLRRLAALLLPVVVLAVPAHAAPERIIVLRHGEKQDAYRLCSVGVQRALALATRYLGKGAEASLFAPGKPPEAFVAITLHTLELISPAAQSWGKPVILYSALPMPEQSEADLTRLLNMRTQEAARDVLLDPRWSGKTVVMAWEHHHIADQKLEQSFPSEKVTLRQLLNLDTIKDVPHTWPGDNYDYFWIAEYGRRGAPVPTRFESRKQSFRPPFASVPSNDWGEKPTYPSDSGCLE